jgi:hypothetical protein
MVCLIPLPEDYVAWRENLNVFSGVKELSYIHAEVSSWSRGRDLRDGTDPYLLFLCYQ